MAAPQPFSPPTACSWSNELNGVERRRRFGAHIWATILPLSRLRHACSKIGCSAAVRKRLLALWPHEFVCELTLGSRPVSFNYASVTNDQSCDNIACGYVADMRVRLRWRRRWSWRRSSSCDLFLQRTAWFYGARRCASLGNHGSGHSRKSVRHNLSWRNV